MKTQQFVSIIPQLLTTPSRISIELVSGPGWGKSAIVNSIPDIMYEHDGSEWKIAEIFCPNVEYPDLAGLNYKGEMTRADGTVLSISDPTVPDWCILDDGSTIWDHEHGVVILEEIGQAGPEVRKTLANLRLQGRIGRWQIPDGWRVIALSNRATDRSGVTKQYDHEINRRIEIHLDADPKGWEVWANEAGIHPMLVAFAINNPEIVWADTVPEKQGPFCTPRSVEILNHALMPFVGDDGALPLNDVTLELANGTIGQAASHQFIATAKLWGELPKTDAIIRDPLGVHCPAETNPGAQALACYKLATEANGDNFDALMAYVGRMPSEYTVTFMRSACARNRRLTSTKAFIDFVTSNRDLVNAVVPTRK